MKKELTPKQYAKLGGVHCPICEGTIEGSSVDICEGGAVQECVCLDCGAEWRDTYTLNGYIELEPGDKIWENGELVSALGGDENGDS